MQLHCLEMVTWLNVVLARPLYLVLGVTFLEGRLLSLRQDGYSTASAIALMLFFARITDLSTWEDQAADVRALCVFSTSHL